MKYAFLLFEDESNFVDATPEQQAKIFAAYGVYTQALTEAGVFVAGEPVDPARDGVLVRLSDSATQVQDGPFTEAKEQLGGFYVVDVPDLDSAVDWAARCPCAETGVVEVRPAVQFD